MGWDVTPVPVATGAVDDRHLFRVTAHGTQAACVAAVRVASDLGHVCDVVGPKPSAQGGHWTAYDLAPSDDWVARGGSLRDLLGLIEQATGRDALPSLQVSMLTPTGLTTYLAPLTRCRVIGAVSELADHAQDAAGGVADGLGGALDVAGAQGGALGRLGDLFRRGGPAVPFLMFGLAGFLVWKTKLYRVLL
jgi:hypothetical protein